MKKQLHSAYVWIFSGLALATYGFLGLTQTGIPGVENLINFINSATGILLFVAVFIAIFLEGTYVIGSVIPGTSFVLFTTILAQTGGPLKYLSVISVVYIGWLLAGVFNVTAASFLSGKLKSPETDDKLESHAEVSWFPAFRANMEVAQTLEGYRAKDVLKESFRIKTYACLGLTVYALVVPLLLNLDDMNNEEGFKSLAVIALVNIGVGVYKILRHHNKVPDLMAETKKDHL